MGQIGKVRCANCNNPLERNARTMEYFCASCNLRWDEVDIMGGERTTRPSEQKALDKKQKQIEETANWEDIADEMPDVPENVERYFKLNKEKKVIEAELEKLKPVVEAAVIIGGKKALGVGNYRVTRVEHPGNPIFRPEKLVEKLAGFGLNAEQITEAVESATTRKPYTYPVISEVKGDPIQES